MLPPATPTNHPAEKVRPLKPVSLRGTDDNDRRPCACNHPAHPEHTVWFCAVNYRLPEPPTFTWEHQWKVCAITWTTVREEAHTHVCDELNLSTWLPLNTLLVGTVQSVQFAEVWFKVGTLPLARQLLSWGWRTFNLRFQFPPICRFPRCLSGTASMMAWDWQVHSTKHS